jgi:hypothetical protein
MDDIFNENKIYPHGGKIKDHFREFYDAVFIAYLPFLKVENHHEEYPTDSELYNHGKIVNWETIVKDAKLKDTAELNTALRTLIGALRPIFRKPELSDKVNALIKKDNIRRPTEGYFDVFTRLGMYKSFKMFNKNEIMLVDEFFEEIKSINLKELTEYEFLEKFGHNDYYIFSSDKEILFTMDWDSFFFLIATDKNKMDRIIAANYFEGFLCDSETTHNWDYMPGELENLLKIEKEQNKGTG